jgi:hypothetical protein
MSETAVERRLRAIEARATSILACANTGRCQVCASMLAEIKKDIAALLARCEGE